ncbi:hypothetical protein D3C85_1085990 [compost metagenome]
MVGGAHEGAAGGVGEAQPHGDVFELVELCGRHVALHRQVVAARLQILAQGQHVDAVLAQVLEHLDDLLVGLAKAHHDTGLGRHMGVHLLDAAQQLQGPLVVGTRAGNPVHARGGFQVVVEHVRGRLAEHLQRLLHAAAEVRGQDLDAGLGAVLADLLDAVGEVLGTAVAQIVAVHRGDDHVFQPHLLDGERQLLRLFGIQCQRAAVGHVAEGAAAGADGAHDHEGGRAVVEALRQVGAGGLFTYRVQLVLAQGALDMLDLLARRRQLDPHPVRLAQHFLVGIRHEFHRDQGHLVAIAQLDARLHTNGFAHDSLSVFVIV